MSSPREREAELLFRARTQGAVHLVALHLVRLKLLRRSPFALRPKSNNIVEIVGRRRPAGLVAFLATFRSKEKILVLPLKAGINRVGASSIWGDYDLEVRRPKILEARQWIIVCLDDRVLVADDHSTNGSLHVLGSSTELVSKTLGELVREEEAESVTQLDWAGDTVCRLDDGDVLVNTYGALVFGRIPEEYSEIRRKTV